MMMLNHNLRIFITAAETGSLTETAKKLYISQPAISQAIKKLEEELQVKLFIRNKRASLTLTDTGKKILLHAVKMVDLENKIYQDAYEVNHLMSGVVRVASVPNGISMIMSRVLPVYKKQFPGVRVELLEGSPYEVKNMVLNYQVDLGISTSPYMGLMHQHLLKDRMVSIHRDEAVQVDLRDDALPLVLCRVARDSILEQLSGESVNLSHALVVDAASTQINMVQNGNGAGVISELMLSSIQNGLVRGETVPSVEYEIALIAHDFDDLTSAAKEMAEMILQRHKSNT